MADPKNDTNHHPEEAEKLPEDKDRDYGPYGQQRPGQRPDPDAKKERGTGA